MTTDEVLDGCVLLCGKWLMAQLISKTAQYFEASEIAIILLKTPCRKEHGKWNKWMGCENY